MKNDCTVTIFEGVDCSGKTTAAKQFAEFHNADYVHFSAMLNYQTDLPRVYIEAMMPALLGYKNVVLDRSWLSERPYADVFRGGKSRLTTLDVTMLELVAAKCQASVIYCDPPYFEMENTFKKRLKDGDEMLESVAQHKAVYDAYDIYRSTSLPVVAFDYTTESINKIYLPRPFKSTIGKMISGSLSKNGGLVVVGDFKITQGDSDPFMQFPCVNFTSPLDGLKVPPQLQLLYDLKVGHGVNVNTVAWVDINEDLSELYNVMPCSVVAIGPEAQAKLYDLRIVAWTVPDINELISNEEEMQNLVQLIKAAKK